MDWRFAGGRMNVKFRIWLLSLLAFLVGLSLLLGLHTHGRVIHIEWLIPMIWLIGPLLIIDKIKFFWRTQQQAQCENMIELTPVLILFAFLFLSLFSNMILHKWFYFLDWKPGTMSFESSMVWFILLTSLLIPFFLFSAIRIPVFLATVLFISQLACMYYLLKETGGAPIYRDDHASFIFRLWEFSKTFPRLLNYNPFWNGGVADFVGTTSGINAIGIPFWPLWKFFSVQALYTYLIGLAYIFIVPSLAIVSLRLMGASWTGALCAGILYLGVSQHYFLWLLNYGTVGAVFASAFVLPVSACVYRVLWLDKREYWLAGLLIIATFELLQWPPGALMCVPIAMSLILNFRQWSHRKLIFLVACGFCILLMEAYPVLTIFLEGKDVTSYVQVARTLPSIQFIFLDGLKYLMAHIHEANPILIFLGLGGIFVLPFSSVRQWVWPILLGLAVITGWGPSIKPNLQLGRFSIPLLFITVVPASMIAEKLFASKNINPYLAFLKAGLAALLILTGWNVSKLYGNAGLAKYVCLSDEIQDITQWIKQNTSPDDRILFAGMTVHAYGRGHVAPLPVLSDREMMSVDYYHFPFDTIEHDYPPADFRVSKEKMLRYFELYNVTHILTYHEHWKEYFRNNVDSYEELITLHDKTIFKVRRSSSLFLKGNGKIQANFNDLDIYLNSPETEVVLKYNWVQGLKASDGVEIFPYDAGDGVCLIGVLSHENRSFQIFFNRYF